MNEPNTLDSGHTKVHDVSTEIKPHAESMFVFGPG